MIPLKVKIKPLSQDDVIQLEKYFPQAKEKHRRRLDEQKHASGTYLVAWYNKMPVGHLNIHWPGNTSATDTFPIPDSSRLEDLQIGLAFQRRGVGTALLKTAEKLAKEKGFARLTLSVAIENLAARTLYAKIGYIDSGYPPVIEKGMYEDEYGNKHYWQKTCSLFVKYL